MKPIAIVFLVLSALPGGCAQKAPKTGSSPFEYREVYLPGAGETEGLDLNSVDRDWGIWGHNLSVVLPQKPSLSVYAQPGSGIDKDQFCFSSDALFGYIKEFIVDNYGRTETTRFAILPNDNSVVCQCKQCVAHGNTPTDASGAVYYLLERLTEEFPDHLFFTSHYRTASRLPEHPLPENAGVLISAMDYPPSAVNTPAEDAFLALLDRWSVLTGRIYVWDYINDFDDYLTPYPVFDVIQRRLQRYELVGVKGVFLNGSGPDYSTMHELKTAVLSALLTDPETDWRPMLRHLCRGWYPVTGDLICDFMIRQEEMVAGSGNTLPLYEGVPVAMRTYLPAGEFEQFHDALLAQLPQTEGREREEVGKMARALMLTRLEVKRISSDPEGSAEMLEELEAAAGEGLVTYSESGGSIADYVADYRDMLAHAGEAGEGNLLKGVRLEALTDLDPDYTDLSILTDGLLGLPSNYHCGQLICSANPALRIQVPEVEGMKRLRVHFTKNAIFHIAFPLSVTLGTEARDLEKKVPRPVSGNLQRAVVEFDLPAGLDGPFVLTIYRDLKDRTMALDEIEGF